MGRNVEIPVKLVPQGDKELAALKNALGGMRAETGATQRALEGYDRASESAAKSTANTAKHLGQARDEMGRFVAGAGSAGKAARDLGGDLDTGLIVKLAGVAGSLKALTYETAQYAARTETLSVVTDRLARVNNLSVSAVQAQVQAVRKQGITYQESLSTVNKMIQAQLDLKKSTDLARLAQDAAVIGGMNSSEALAGIIHGITTRQTDVLRTYGIIVDFESAYAAAAKKAGHELSAMEKQQVALNAVLEQGAKITGSYEAAMGTAGKQLTSLSRHFDDLKQSIGEGYVPALGRAVSLMEQFAKWGSNNVDVMQKITTAGTAAAVGYAAFQLAGLTPVGRGVKLGAAAVATAATYFGLDQDPIEYAKDSASEQMAAMNRKRQRVNEQFAALSSGGGKPSKEQADAYKRTLTMLDEVEADLKSQVASHLAKIYIQRGGKEVGRAEQLAQGLDLGGAKVSRGEVLAEIMKVQQPDLYKQKFGDPAAGATFNQQGYDQAMAAAKAAEMAELAAKAAKASAEDRTKFLDQIARLKLPIDPITGKTEAGASVELEREFALRDARKQYGRANDGQINALYDLQKQEALKKQYEDQQKVLERQAKDAQDLAQAWSQITAKAGDKNLELSLKLLGGGIKDGERLLKLQKDLQGIEIGQDREQLTRQASRAERMAQLEAGTNGNPQVIERMYRIRLDLAAQIYRKDLDAAALLDDANERALANARALGNLKREMSDAEINREMQLLELQKRRLQEFRQGAGQVFDAMTQRGTAGIQELAMGQLRNIQRTMFMNVSEKLYGTIGQSMGTHGIDANSKFGWIFKGSPLEKLGQGGTPPFLPGAKNPALDASTLRITLSQDRLKLSIDNLARVISQGGTAGIGGIGGLLPGGSTTLDAVANAARGGQNLTAALLGLPSGASSLDAVSNASRGTQNVRNAGLYIPASGTFSNGGGNGLSGVGEGIAVGAGALGVYAGIKQGGAQGYTNAAAAGLGTAAALSPEPISKAALAIAALATSFVGSFLGPNPDKRNADIDSRIENSRFNEADPIFRSIDRSGRDVDFDKRGNARVNNSTVNLNVQIQALDQKSIMDMGPGLADSLQYQLLRKHPISDEIRQAR